MQNRVLIITGPTAVGKSDVALEVADALCAEIINIDSGQMYQPLTIGTAKPDWKHSSIMHHGFDTLIEPKDYTVVAYRAYAQSLVKDIVSRNKVPLFVGGSLFYIQSLFFPVLNNEHINVDEAPANFTWDALYAIDPVRAQAIHPNDIYRIKRACAFWYATKQRPSTFSPCYQPPFNAHCVFLTRDRATLYTRINDRVTQMFNAGFFNEVRELRGTDWEPFLKQKKLIGYDDVLNYFDHDFDEQSYQRLIATIQQKTRHYAKRQHTFWRMFARRLAHAHDAYYTVTTETVDLTTCDYDLYSSRLVARIRDSLH